MGINTVAVLFNDQVAEFRNYGPLGHRIADAITHGWSMRDRDSLGPWFGTGIVVSQAHSSYDQVVVCGHNGGRPVHEVVDGLSVLALEAMAECLRRHGWTAKPPPARKRAKKET